MSLNPLTLLSDFINERGSAAILGKHVDFFKDQISALKEERAVSERQLAALASENADLKSENSRIQSENQTLRQQMQDLTNPPDTLSEEAKKTLKLFFDAPEPYAAYYFARRLGISEGVAKYHIDQLYEQKLVAVVGMGPIYAINSKGRKYVMEKLA